MTRKAEIALCFALPEEREVAIARLVPGSEVHRQQIDGRDYYEFECEAYAIVAIETGMGPEKAGPAVQRLLETYDVSQLVQIGIAGSLDRDKAQLGDVVAALSIDAFSGSAKVVDDDCGTSWRWQGRVYDSDETLLRGVRRFLTSSEIYRDWQNDGRARLMRLVEGACTKDAISAGELRRTPELLAGVIASASILSTSPQFNRHLKERRNRSLVAIEMESCATYAVASECGRRVRTLALRGISDLADGAKADLERSNQGRFRQYATENAMGVFLRLARMGVFERSKPNAKKGQARAREKTDVMRGPDADLRKDFALALLGQNTPPDEDEPLRILLVDDDRIARRAYAKMLSRQNFLVTQVDSAEEALEELAATRFDTVVTDLQMPGMDGLSLARAALAQYPGLSVAVMTGLGSPELAAEASVIGCMAFLEKRDGNEQFQKLGRDVRLWNQLKGLAARVWPCDPQSTLALSQCRHRIAEFMRDNASDDEFDRAMRHKVKESVYALAKRLSFGPCTQESGSLLQELAKLKDVMSRLHHNQPQGLTGYFEGMKVDFEYQYPALRLNTAVNVPSPIVDVPELSALLLIVSIELIDNAKDALAGVGQIDVELRQSRTAPQITLKVRNDGPPISAQVASGLFREGFSTKGPGRGLGLALVQRLLARFDGTVEHRHNNGVEFLVTVPLRKAWRGSASRTHNN